MKGLLPDEIKTKLLMSILSDFDQDDRAAVLLAFLGASMESGDFKELRRQLNKGLAMSDVGELTKKGLQSLIECLDALDSIVPVFQKNIVIKRKIAQQEKEAKSEKVEIKEEKSTIEKIPAFSSTDW